VYRQQVEVLQVEGLRHDLQTAQEQVEGLLKQLGRNGKSESLAVNKNGRGGHGVNEAVISPREVDTSTLEGTSSEDHPMETEAQRARRKREEERREREAERKKREEVRKESS